MHEIRSFHANDRTAIVEIDNRHLPPERRYSVGDWEQTDAARPAGMAGIRLVAGDPAIAYLDVTDRRTAMPPWPGVCAMELLVAPEHRHQGIGGQLFDKALAFAQERKAHTLLCSFYQYTPDEPGIAFLEGRGFVEYNRRVTGHFELANLDLTRFTAKFETLEQLGVRVYAYDSIPDAEERRRLYELYTGLFEPALPFEEWEAAEITGFDPNTEMLMVAEYSGRLVSMVRLAEYNRETRTMRAIFTGTLNRYRRRGIALALKLRAFELLRERGYQVVLTSNRADNQAILELNHQIGFADGPHELTFTRMLNAQGLRPPIQKFTPDPRSARVSDVSRPPRGRRSPKGRS